MTEAAFELDLKGRGVIGGLLGREAMHSRQRAYVSRGIANGAFGVLFKLVNWNVKCI